MCSGLHLILLETSSKCPFFQRKSVNPPNRAGSFKFRKLWGSKQVITYRSNCAQQNLSVREGVKSAKSKPSNE